MKNEHSYYLHGEYQARVRWNTQASGAAFDRKKRSFLSSEAQRFLAQQAMCVVARMQGQERLTAKMLFGSPGFISSPEPFTCLLHGESNEDTHFLNASSCGHHPQMSLFFINHVTRQRLCVHGQIKKLAHIPSTLWLRPRSPHLNKLSLHVEQAFFHCPKYIHTNVAGLTAPAVVRFNKSQLLRECQERARTALSFLLSDFLQQQTVCFLCTVNRKNVCAINHRGGAAGFLLALPPDRCSPGGRLLLPDYQGNGAFEAVGNIFETGLATLIIPDYSMHLALIIAGKARVLERAQLSSDLQAKYKGAERFIDIAVQQIDMQHGDWAPSLAYTQTIANMPEKAEDKLLCPVLI